METVPKKRGQISPQRGRPSRGALSTYPKQLVKLIKDLRSAHEGWGAISILVELQEEYGYSPKDLPSIDTVNRYLKQKGFIKKKEPKGRIPQTECPKAPKRFHDLWEMDAQGTIPVEGIGYQSMINIKDQKSKIHCMAFPVAVKTKMSQPNTLHYLWALRLAFQEWGLPKCIQVDHDSVFTDNTSNSPFPSQLHLWLIGLGIRLCFIDRPPPQKQAMVERSHQTMERQVVRGQKYVNWKTFFSFCNKRRKRLNEKLPNRLLDKKAPLVIFPQAKHSGRIFEIEKEASLVDMKKVYHFLSQCVWYRKVSGSRTASLSGKIYYLKEAVPKTPIQITFCKKSKNLIFRDANELVVAKRPIKGFSIENLMTGTSKEIISMRKKLVKLRDFPLKT